MAFRKLLENLEQNPWRAHWTGLWLIMHRQLHLTDAPGITTFYYEIGLLKRWSQVAKSVAVNSLSGVVSEHGLLGEVALGIKQSHLGVGEKDEGGKETGGQESGRPAAGAVALSCASCYSGSDPKPCPMSWLPSCSQSPNLVICSVPLGLGPSHFRKLCSWTFHQRVLSERWGGGSITLVWKYQIGYWVEGHKWPHSRHITNVLSDQLWE